MRSGIVAAPGSNRQAAVLIQMFIHHPDKYISLITSLCYNTPTSVPNEMFLHYFPKLKRNEAKP